MAELARYQRSEAAQAVKTSKADSNNMFKLADRLREFSNRAMDREDQQAGIEGKQSGMDAASGKIGGVDLSDNSTIRSRAFNQGAQMSHAAQIKIDINENMSRLYQDNQYDLEAFTTKAAGYKKGLLAEVDPSMYALAEADINSAMSNGTIKIGDTLYKKERTEQVASIKKAVDISEELALQLSANGDIEGADAQIAQIAAAIQVGIDQKLPGIDQEYLDSYMAKLTESADSELVLGVFKRELENNGIDAAEKALDAFAAYDDELVDDNGDEVSIKPGTKRSIVGSMETLINRAKADRNGEQSKATALHNAKKKILKDDVTQHIKALDLNQFPDTLEDLKKSLVGFPELQRDLQRAEKQAAAAAVFMKHTPEIMANTISDMSGKKDLSPAEAVSLKRIKAIHKDTLARMKTDILSLAAEQGIIGELDPIDFADPEAIKNRILQYRTAQDHYGTTGGTPLTEPETTQLVDKLADTETSASRKMVLLSSLVEGFGDASQDLFENMFDKSAPQYIVVGELINEAVSTNNNSLLRIGENILLGMEAMEKGLVDLDPELTNDIRVAFGRAAEANPDYAQMIIKSARALYAHRHKGNIEDAPDMEKEIDKILTEITGGILEFNGRKFIAPNRTIKQDAFDNYIEKALTRHDLNAMGGVHLNSYTAAEALELVKDGQFVSVGQGKYTILIKDGDQYLKNKHYETFIFNWDTEHGITETWSEDGFKVDYEELEAEEIKSAAIASEAAVANEVVEVEELDQMIVTEYSSEESANESRVNYQNMSFTQQDGRVYAGTINMKDGVPYDGLGRKLIMKENK